MFRIENSLDAVLERRIRTFHIFLFKNRFQEAIYPLKLIFMGKKEEKTRVFCSYESYLLAKFQPNRNMTPRLG